MAVSQAQHHAGDPHVWDLGVQCHHVLLCAAGEGAVHPKGCSVPQQEDGAWSPDTCPAAIPVLPGKTSSPSKDLGLGAAEPGLMHGVKWHKRTGRAQAHQGHMCQEQDAECQSPSLRAECTGCRNIHQDSMSKPFPHWAGVTCAPPVPPPAPTLQPGPTPPPPTSLK